jgi:membrane fusion protein, multidrug efflux system
VRFVTLQRVPNMTEQCNQPVSIDAQPTANGDALADHDAESAQPPPESRAVAAESHAVAPEPRPVPEGTRKAMPKRKLVAGVLGLAVLTVLVVFGIPWVKDMLNTVSTDDAYVKGHVTFVAPRVAGQIARVLVDDNNRVHQGDLIAELDKEPYQVAVSEKQAAVDTAKADLQAAIAAARAIEAQAMSQRWNLQHAVQNVDDQVALLHARVADVEKSKAALVLAQLQFDRARALVARDDVPREVYDQRQAELTTAGAELTQSLADVYQIRVSLGLPAQPKPAEPEPIGLV